ncbi:hypothetical protein WJ22_20865 [Burkholderia vietnamiensis]|nr:hypothetical protein WJ18_11500 [Burkholderia vietnamiensis]KVF85555.1 hypothetical protein WJ19_14855 [Burkholderia vietnamiensis]KVF94176.1 hypothetical protein WJ20_03470 [Burkholderia vietnamiensis]KVF98132.1 hypothetical protein WJ22_20865 [Burkholderia vietnamiensis]
MAVQIFLSTTPNIPQHVALDRRATDQAVTLLQTVFDTYRPATLAHAYRAWRDDPLTRDFAEAVGAYFLRDYRDDGADSIQVEPTAELAARAREFPGTWTPVRDAVGDTECYTRGFVGHLATLQREADEQWRLTFLGYRSKPFPSRQIAERDAPSFALEVLDAIAQQIEA